MSEKAIGEPEEQPKPDLLELARLKQAYDEGMASGEGRHIDREAFMRELKDQRSKRG